ncbi:MAG: hypothetical protein VKN33_02700 [Candidatus Sericytochromatia bacterium]|nr:hypothetical protein [Candidatus Sericytochromatia bacterium]
MATPEHSIQRTALNFTYLNWSELRREVGCRAREIEQARWALGDLLAHTYSDFEKTPQLAAAFDAAGISWRDLSEAIGVPVTDLKRYARVATAFPRRKRVSGVGWEYHSAVLGALPSASLTGRQKWLREAARHNWSIRSLIKRIKRSNIESAPFKPRPLSSSDPKKNRDSLLRIKQMRQEKR